jgi:membrane dipeptidase
MSRINGAIRAACTPRELTRRDLLTATLATSWGLALAACTSSSTTSWRMEELDSRVPALLDSAVSIDMHTHAAGALNARVQTYDLADHMRRGHMSAVCLCHTGDGPAIHVDGVGYVRQYRTPEPGELWAYTQRRLAFMDDLVANRGLRRVLGPDDLVMAKAVGQPALIGTIEGCDFVEGKLERVQEVYGRGIRQLQIVHYMQTPLGDRQTASPTVGGLGVPGADIVRECNRLGIVVDTAHGTYELVRQTAKISTVPFVLSHTSLSEFPPGLSRRISVDHAKLMAEVNGYYFPSMKSYAAGIARMVDVAGVDHVGIGTDMEGTQVVWDDYANLPVLVDALLKQGFSPDEAAKVLGGNYLRVWRQVVAARTA